MSLLDRQFAWLKSQCECETIKDEDSQGLCPACGVAMSLSGNKPQWVQTISGEWVTATVCGAGVCDERVRLARESTWRRAAMLVDYYTGRDLDVLDDEYRQETGR